MKRLVLVLFLLVSMGASAQESSKLVQYLDLSSQKQLNIIVSGHYTTVLVYQDTVDYVAIRDPLWSDTASLNAPFFQLTGHDFFTTLVVFGQARTGVVEIHLKREDLYLVSRYYNHVYLTSESDTLKFDHVQIQADDYSIVELKRPLVANDVVMEADKFSSIYYSSYSAGHYSENDMHSAIIQGNMRNGRAPNPKKRSGFNHKIRRTGSFTHRYRPEERLHLSFTAALLTAGSSTLSPIGFETNHYREGLYYPEFKTTLGSYIGEVSYDVVSRRHLALALGVGFSYNKYKFKDGYVDYIHNIQPASIDYFANNYLTPTIPPYGGVNSQEYWSTYLTTRYLILPISFTYYANTSHRKGFHVGLAWVPSIGLGKGILRSNYSEWYSPDDGSTIGGFVVNDYHNQGLDLYFLNDIRLSMGWARWSVMVQFSPSRSFSMSDNSLIPAYPFRVGVTMNL